LRGTLSIDKNDGTGLYTQNKPTLNVTNLLPPQEEYFALTDLILILYDQALVAEMCDFLPEFRMHVLHV